MQRFNNDRLSLEAAQNQLEQDSQNLTVLIHKKLLNKKREKQSARKPRVKM
jgi:hypothetical protein